MPLKRFGAILIFILASVMMASAGEPAPVFLKRTESKLIFELEPDSSSQIRVFLRIANRSDSDLTWVCNSFMGIEAELLDAEGKPASVEAVAASITYNHEAYLIPFGSRLDWLISHGGISGRDPSPKEYVLVAGGQRWLIPKGQVGSYLLRVRLRGIPWDRSEDAYDSSREKLLLDLPSQKIVLTP